MKKVLFILFITISSFAKSQDVQIVYTNVLHGDTSFLVKITNTYQLDSQLRYVYSNHLECDSALVNDTMKWVCTLILDTTSYWYPFKTLISSVRDSSQVSQPRIRDTIIWLRNQMFNLIADNSTALGRNILNISTPASNSVVVATAGGNAVTRTATELLSDIGAASSSHQHTISDITNFPTTTAFLSNSTNKNFVTDAQATVIGNTSGTNTGDNATNTQYSGLSASKQNTLVSGTNIKTINGNTLLGSGDVVVGGGATSSTSGVAATATASGTQTITHNLGRTPTIIRIYSISNFTNSTSATPVPFSNGIWNSSGNRCVYMVINGTTAQASQTSTVFSVIMVTSAGNQITGVIQNVTSTGFDIVWTETGTHTAGNYLWEAQ